jgi:hypothetical protein
MQRYKRVHTAMYINASVTVSFGETTIIIKEANKGNRK